MLYLWDMVVLVAVAGVIIVNRIVFDLRSQYVVETSACSKW